jgi:hypothetical protein
MATIFLNTNSPTSLIAATDGLKTYPEVTITQLREILTIREALQVF